MTKSDKVQQGIDLVDSLTDEELNRLVDYIRVAYKNRAARRNALAQSAMGVGTRVRFDGRRKPQYLEGMTGVIEEKRQTRVTVRLDAGPVGKFRSGRVITPAGGLTVID